MDDGRLEAPATRHRQVAPETEARELLSRLRQLGLTVATAESLTGGLLCSTLVDVPGASDVVRGGVVAYATDLKTQLLGVDAALLAAGGPVQALVAEQMAVGACRLMRADLTMATTGVAGPGDSEAGSAGLVYVAVCLGGKAVSRELHLAGGRTEVRLATVAAVINLALEQLAGR